MSLLPLHSLSTDTAQNGYSSLIRLSSAQGEPPWVFLMAPPMKECSASAVAASSVPGDAIPSTSIAHADFFRFFSKEVDCCKPSGTPIGAKHVQREPCRRVFSANPCSSDGHP